MFICTCCHTEGPDRRKYVLFSIGKYDQNNDAVTKALCYRFSKPQLREMICRRCHYSLKKLNIPRNAVSSPVKATRCNVPRCVICSTCSGSRMHIFTRCNYGDNLKLDSALQTSCVPDGSTICQKCHKQFTRLSMFSCIICSSLTECRHTVLFDLTHLSNASIDVPSEEEAHGEKRVCKPCHTRATNRCNPAQCIICSAHSLSRMHTFRHCSYGNNPKLDSALQTSCVPDGSTICQKCHRQFTRLSMFSCIICSSLKERRHTVLFDPTHLSNASIDVPLEEEIHGEKRDCKMCHTRATNGLHKCLVCSRDVQKQSVLEYCSAHYDFNSFIVSRCIPCNQEDTDKKYICTDCHTSLALCTV